MISTHQHRGSLSKAIEGPDGPYPQVGGDIRVDPFPFPYVFSMGIDLLGTFLLLLKYKKATTCTYYQHSYNYFYTVHLCVCNHHISRRAFMET